MKTRTSHLILALFLVSAFAAMLPQAALAAGTAACTSIANTASVVYSVGSVTQTALSTGPSGTFVVGNKVNLTVATTDVSAVLVSPGGAGTAAALQFTVRNDGNAFQRYTLTPIVYTNLTSTDPFGGADTDNFDATAVEVWVDTGGGFVQTNTISSLASDVTATVQVRANTIPLTQVNNDFAIYGLKAVTINTDGVTALVAGTGNVFDAGGGTVCTGVDIVFADTDADGADANDGNRDAAFLAKSAYKVETVSLVVSKSTGTPLDPFGGTAAIPGSIVEYTIRVARNAGSGSATGIVMTDTVPATTAPVADQYSATAEVRRITYDAAGPTTTTTDLVNGTDADLQNWAITAGALVRVSCGAFVLDTNGDYCEIKFKVQIQ